MSEQAAEGPTRRNGTNTIFNEGVAQHWIKEVGNRESRLVYQGELTDIER